MKDSPLKNMGLGNIFGPGNPERDDTTSSSRGLSIPYYFESMTFEIKDGSDVMGNIRASVGDFNTHIIQFGPDKTQKASMLILVHDSVYLINQVDSTFPSLGEDVSQALKSKILSQQESLTYLQNNLKRAGGSNLMSVNLSKQQVLELQGTFSKAAKSDSKIWLKASIAQGDLSKLNPDFKDSCDLTCTREALYWAGSL